MLKDSDCNRVIREIIKLRKHTRKVRSLVAPAQMDQLAIRVALRSFRRDCQHNSC